jgi:hypothetical protein
VQGRIEDGTLFPNISFTLERLLTALAKNILKEPKGYFDGIFHLIRADLEMILDTRSDPVEAENEASVEQFKQALDVLKARRQELSQRIKDI